MKKYYIHKYKKIKSKFENYNVMTIEETILAIINTGACVSRFGDGEFKWIAFNHRKGETFQENSYELSKRLKEVLLSNQKNHIICISPAFQGLDYCEQASKEYWQMELARCGKEWIKWLDKRKTYFNANISRFYMSDINKKLAKSRFDLLKKIWENKEILIVEGEKSRLGIGNDLFDNALSIERILAPSQNAFNKYDKILEKVLIYGKDKLVLIALGPTATVLAYDLSKYGFQAIDIGHVDIEYEWFLKGVTEKVSIKGKSVNEVAEQEVEELDKIYLEKYYSQVLDRVK